MISSPRLITQAQWGPLPRGLDVVTLEAGLRPNISNIGDSPSLIGGCTVAPDLPDGLSLFTSLSTCVLGGTPTVVSDLTNYTITATNVAGSSSVMVSFAVERIAPQFPAIDRTIVYTGPFVEFVNLTGEVLDSCVLGDDSPELPAGMVLDVEMLLSLSDPEAEPGKGDSCVISGTPDDLNFMTTEQTYIIAATNDIGTTEFSITIEFSLLPPDLLVLTTPYTFVVGVPVDLKFNNIGSPIEECTVDGNLPTGLSISVNPDTQSCQITGTPMLPTMPRVVSITSVNPAGTGVDFISIEVIESAAISALEWSNEE